MENEKFIGSTIIIGAVVGGFVLLIAYIVRLFKADTKQNERSLAGKASEQQQQQLRQKQKKEHQHQQQGHAVSGTASSVKNKKKTADSRWIGRNDKQNFAHPWLLTSLKGHTGQVLDMDFSSNGKYLASCAEEEPDPGGDQGATSSSSSSSSSSSASSCSSSSSSDCNKENSEPSSAAPSPRTTKGLSRRQRKNRRRDDSSPPENNNTKKKPKPKRPDQFLNSNSNSSSNNGSNNNNSNISSSNHYISKRSIPPPHVSLKQFVKLNISERDLASFLRAYLLSPEQMLTMGYPVESSLHPGKAIIFKSPISVPSYSSSDYRHAKIDVNKSRFDVNAREFVPGRRGSSGGCVDYAHIKAEWNANHHDSGNGSSGSSSDLDDGEDGGRSEASNTTTSSSSDGNSGSFAKPDDDCDTSSSVANKLVNKIKECDLHGGNVGEEHKCVRCGKGFYVGSDNEYVTQEKCQYHWGKLRNVTGRHTKNLDSDNSEYACCRGKSDSRGCTTGKFHVWNGLAIGFNGPFDLYVRTRPRKTPPPDSNYGVYALDCEMCYTAQGLELTKITVIGVDGRLVYDCFVKPECEIVDYNTRFSGITAKDLSRKGTTKTLREVQNDLMGFINADTILIGHGLENDLRALRIIHSTVIDTAVTFPHYNGLPYRRSLKSLTSCFLKREIQQSGHGHNSNEDSRACMELMLWRVRKDFRSILDHYHHQ